jgi:hypothetical protein
MDSLWIQLSGMSEYKKFCVDMECAPGSISVDRPVIGSCHVQLANLRRGVVSAANGMAGKRVRPFRDD